MIRKWDTPFRTPLISNSNQPNGGTVIQPSQGAADRATIITSRLEQNSIERELSVLDICLVTRSRTALESEAATAISAEIPMVVGSGLRMINTPIKPRPMVSQRPVLTRSLRMIGASAAINIGLEKTIATI